MSHSLSTELMNQACTIFLSLAYPAGQETIPAKKRHFLALPPGLSMRDLLENDAATRESCQLVHAKTGEVCALLLRLGCVHYPHLKVKAQLIDDVPGSSWLFSVDTHDAYSKTSFLPPPTSPDADVWRTLQAANVALKEKVEAAWEKAGLLTFNGLLRRDLPPATPPQP